MVARAGTYLTGQIASAFTIADQNDTAKLSISPQVVTGPTALQNPEHIELETRKLPVLPVNESNVARYTEILPIEVHSRDQRSNIRGEGNTGRWQNLGKAPQDGNSFGFDYWEKLFLNPTFKALGNIVSDTIFNATVRNTFRRENKTLNSIDNNAGAGITITGAATPANLAPLADKVYIVTVTTQGPPDINGTVDFVTTAGTLQLLITGTRIIIFPHVPQSNIKESLKWLTDVVRSADGSEQRHALREYPRQSVEYEIITNTLPELNKVRNLMVGWTSRVFGVPIWWYERSLRADVTATDLTVYVRTGGLDYADFRVGGLAMVYQEDADGIVTTDTLQIASIIMSVNSPESEVDSITFATAIQNNYDASIASVVPVVPGIMASPAKQSTPADGESSKFNMKFDMVDNEATVPALEVGLWPELEDFDTNPTLIIDDKNTMQGARLIEQYEQKLQRIDFNQGKFQQLSQELTARRSTPFNWIVEDVTFEWQMRSLLYYLRGKLRNAWVPTNRHDFEVNANIGIGAVSIDVANWGFNDFVDGQTPWAGIRLTKTNGNISYHRIDSADNIDATTERLNISPGTPEATTVEEVDKLDLMILTRMATDDVSLIHNWFDSENNDLDTEIETVFIGDVQT